MYNMPWKVDILNDERESYPCFKILLKVATNLSANFNPKKNYIFRIHFDQSQLQVSSSCRNSNETIIFERKNNKF